MMGVVEGQCRLAAQHAAEYAPPDSHHACRPVSAGPGIEVGEAARALDEESVVAVQGESSEWLWVMPGLPQAPQGAGGAGLIALEADGDGHQRRQSERYRSAGIDWGRGLGL